MRKFPLTSKKSSLVCLCATAWLNNLGCRRKLFLTSSLFCIQAAARTVWAVLLLCPSTGKQLGESLCKTSLLAHHSPEVTAAREGHGHYRLSSFSSALLAAWLVAIGIGLKESCLLGLSRWRQAVMRATAQPKVVPELLYEHDGCCKLEFILGDEYSQGLRADFSPRLHTCSTVRAARLKESIPDLLVSAPTVSSGCKWTP